MQNPTELKRMGAGEFFLGFSGVLVCSDAPAVLKLMARIAKVVYGALIQVCDGTDDQVELAAINAAANGAKIRIIGNNLNITSGIVNNMTLIGDGASAGYSAGKGTNINVTADPGLWVKPGGRLWGVSVRGGAAYAGRCLTIGGENMYFDHVSLLLDDVQVYCANWAGGIGLSIEASNNAGTPLDAGYVFTSFGGIDVIGSALPLQIVLDKTNSGVKMCYMGGCIFECLFLYGGTTRIAYVKSVAKAPIAGNVIVELQLEPNGAATGIGIEFEGTTAWDCIYANNILDLFCWDWTAATGNQLVMNAYTGQNLINGYFDPTKILDTGRCNDIINRNQTVPKTVVIAAGVLTLSPGIHDYLVDGEAGAADNLDDIEPVNFPVGYEIHLRAKNAAHAITVRHDAVNIKCGANRTLNSPYDVMVLINDGVETTRWCQKAYNDNA